MLQRKMEIIQYNLIL